MVQEPAAGERRLVVHELADLTEGEVVGGLVGRGALLHEPARHELVEPAHGLVVAAAAGGAHDVEGERSADDRRGGEQLGGPVGQRGQAAAQQVTDVGGSGLPAGEGVEVGDDQERQTLALSDHLLGDPGRHRRPVPRRRPARATNPLDSRPRRMATPAPSRSRSASARVSGPASPTSPRALGDDQARPVAAAPVHEVGQHLLGGDVGPLDVVDDEHARGRAAGRRHRAGDAVEEPGLRARSLDGG